MSVGPNTINFAGRKAARGNRSPINYIGGPNTINFAGRKAARGGATGPGIGSLWDKVINLISTAHQKKYDQGGIDINYGPTGHFKFSASPNQGSAPAPTPWPTLPAPWYGQPSGHRIPAFTGYDITNMLRSQMPRKMAEIQLSSVVDQAQGGHSNLLDAITAIQQRNFEQYGQPTSYRSVQPDSSGRYIDPLRNNANRNVPQNPIPGPQYNNVATDYYSNRNNYLPGITGLLGGI